MALSKNVNIDISYFNENSIISTLKTIDNSISNEIHKTITIPNAYIKIINLQGDKANINLTIGIFNKKDGSILKTNYYNFEPNVLSTAKNFIEQGYEYLKTLDGFKDAIDLLDEG
jgi:hypothetical protein